VCSSDLNTYYPPNQPRSDRCYALGQALRQAIESWNGAHADATVGVVASGGLSHFVVDETLDHRVLDAIKARSRSRAAELTQDELVSGTSEVRNWLVVAGATEHLQLDTLDYVPCYRSEAGTGVGMGFASWTDG
jgi:3-O-methylgallate 3,4-dioxygenase